VPKTCAAAELEKRVTTHGLRRSFAFHFVTRGGSLQESKELLGHSKLEMVLRYAHPSTEQASQSMRRHSNHPQTGLAR